MKIPFDRSCLHSALERMDIADIAQATMTMASYRVASSPIVRSSSSVRQIHAGLLGFE